MSCTAEDKTPVLSTHESFNITEMTNHILWEDTTLPGMFLTLQTLMVITIIIKRTFILRSYLYKYTLLRITRYTKNAEKKWRKKIHKPSKKELNGWSINKWVFNLDLNKLSEEDCLMQGGRLFHRFGAAYRNARSPNVGLDFLDGWDNNVGSWELLRR